MTPEEKLKIKTEQFMKADPKQSHKRTKMFIEMQQLVREIKKKQKG